MSMDHKAYQLDYEPFVSELAPLLARALQTGNVDELKAFVERNFSQLKHPAEGDPLGPDWRALVESGEPNLEVQRWADLALTKYYDPSADEGLNAEWEDLDDELQAAGIDASRVVLGRTLGADGNVFDPGRQGAYFQSPEDVRDALQLLEGVTVEEEDVLDQWREILQSAAQRGKGLYVRF
jgi:hypothetical protein